MRPSHPILRAARVLALLIVLAGSGSLAMAEPPAGATPSARRTVHLPLVANAGVPAAGSAQELIAAALKAGRIDYTTSLLYRAYALFADDRLPAELWGSGSEGEDLALFGEATDVALPASVQAKLRPFFLRPDNPASVHSAKRAQATPQATPTALACDAANWAALSSPTLSSKIRVHAKCIGDYEADIRAAHRLIAELWAPMTRHMGLPVLDNGGSDGGGSDEIDLYLMEPLGKIWREGKDRGITGTALAVTWPSAPYSGLRASGYMLLARADIYDETFKSDLAHEFFHVLQNAHNQRIQFHGNTEWWFTEASAKWAEANFVPETAGRKVHPFFEHPFQYTDDSLHRSVDVVDEVKRLKNLQMYASYIWPFFMEQELNEDAIADAWKEIELAGSDWDKGIKAIDAELPFNLHFHRFALRNLNDAFGGDNPLGMRYIDLDKQFPDGKMPQTSVSEHLLARAAADPPLSYPDSIPSLEAHYYYFSVDDAVQQVVFDFSKLQPLLDRKIDAVVKIRGKPWAVWDQLPDLVRFCRDNPDQDLEEIWLVVSDHNTDIDTKVAGALEVRALAAPCGCDPEIVEQVDLVTQWQGHVTFSYSAAASNNQWDIRQHRVVDVVVTLDRQGGVRRSFLGSPTGSASIDDQKVFLVPKPSLFLGLSGGGPPVPYDRQGDRYSRVTLNYSLDYCKYNWGATIYTNATASSEDTPSSAVVASTGSVHSEWLPITKTLVLAGSAEFPVHSPDYIFEHGNPFYEQEDYEFLRILGEDGMGTVNVSWQFTPAAPPPNGAAPSMPLMARGSVPPNESDRVWAPLE